MSNKTFKFSYRAYAEVEGDVACCDACVGLVSQNISDFDVYHNAVPLFSNLPVPSSPDLNVQSKQFDIDFNQSNTFNVVYDDSAEQNNNYKNIEGFETSFTITLNKIAENSLQVNLKVNDTMENLLLRTDNFKEGTRNEYKFLINDNSVLDHTIDNDSYTLPFTNSSTISFNESSPLKLHYEDNWYNSSGTKNLTQVNDLIADGPTSIHCPKIFKGQVIIEII